MKNEIIISFVEGFKDSFRLAGSLFVSVIAVITAFSNHAPSAHYDCDDREIGRQSAHN